MKSKTIRRTKREPIISSGDVITHDKNAKLEIEHKPPDLQQPDHLPTRQKEYWQQVGSIVLGAIIAALSSGVITYIQGKAQSKQFLIDKQIGTLKEYSTSFNQSSSSSLAKIVAVNQKLETLLLVGVENYSDDELEELPKLVSEMTNESIGFKANLITQRTMVYATFGMESPPIDFQDPSNDEDYLQFKENIVKKFKQCRDAKSKSEQNKAVRESITMILDVLSNTQKEMIESINQENESIRRLAEKVHKQY